MLDNEYYKLGYKLGYEEGYEGEDLSEELPDFSGWSKEDIEAFELGRSEGQEEGFWNN